MTTFETQFLGPWRARMRELKAIRDHVAGLPAMDIMMAETQRSIRTQGQIKLAEQVEAAHARADRR